MSSSTLQLVLGFTAAASKQPFRSYSLPVALVNQRCCADAKDEPCTRVCPHDVEFAVHLYLASQALSPPQAQLEQRGAVSNVDICVHQLYVG